jgi:hypothetical protein
LPVGALTGEHAIGVGFVEQALSAEVAKHTVLNDMLELDPVGRGKLTGRMEIGLLVLGGREHAVEHHDVIVKVCVEGGAESMEEGDGAESGVPECPWAHSAQCGADGAHEDPEDGSGDLRVVVKPLMGNRVFGCDICQEVCPWNERFSEPSTEPDYGAREGLDGPQLVALADRLLAMDDAAFGETFQGSPVRRTGRVGLLRNVCVALGNWGSSEAVPILAKALSDSSPLVRLHAAWALGEIGSDEAVQLVRARSDSESDPSVLEEIGGVLSRFSET